jgi:hypothetical protein
MRFVIGGLIIIVLLALVSLIAWGSHPKQNVARWGDGALDTWLTRVCVAVLLYAAAQLLEAMR